MTHVDIPEDRFIKAVEVKPSKGTAVVHHAVASTYLEDDPEISKTLLVEYAVGKYGDIYPTALPASCAAASKLTMNLHLHAIGEEMPANVMVGIKLYPKGYTPKYRRDRCPHRRQRRSRHSRRRLERASRRLHDSDQADPPDGRISRICTTAARRRASRRFILTCTSSS